MFAASHQMSLLLLLKCLVTNYYLQLPQPLKIPHMIFDIMEYNIVFPFMFPFIIIKIAATIPSDIALNDIAKKIIISFITKIS